MNLLKSAGTQSILMFVCFLPLVASGQVYPTTAEVVATISLQDKLEWQFETDLGIMHVYGGDELWSIDLLRGGQLIGNPIPLSGSEDAQSVRHIPKTNMLFVMHGHIESEISVSNVDTSRKGMNSYAVDLFTGEVLWEQAPLEIPDEFHYFPAVKMVILRSIPGDVSTGKKAAKKPSEFTAIDLDTGRILWEREYIARAVWVNDKFLEIVGPTTVSINARTGEEVRIVTHRQHKKYKGVVFTRNEKVLVWKDKKFTLYDIPMLSDEQLIGQNLPLTIAAKELWTIKSDKKLKEIANEPGASWGPKYITDDLLLIKSKSDVEVVDFDSGRSVWIGKTSPSELEISPTGSYGAYASGRKLYVLDMETGLEIVDFEFPDVKKKKTAFPKISWQGDSEFILVFSDRKQRPSSITRFDVVNQTVMWTASLPEPADYKMTSGEKWKLTGNIFLSVALTAVSMGNPVGAGYYNYYFIFIPNLNVKVLPESSAGLEALENSLEGREESGETRAIRRYVERARLLKEVLGKEGLFVTGDDEFFEIVNIDMETGRMKTVANYFGEKIHGIEPDVVYGLAIVQEDNRRTINVISLANRAY